MRPTKCDRVYLVQEGGEDAIAPILDSAVQFIFRDSTHPRRSVIRAYPPNKIKSVYNSSQVELNTLVGAL
jgi:hypothetical protein